MVIANWVRLRTRNQMTLPAKIARHAGVRAGALFECAVKNGKIVLVPKRFDEAPISDDAWDRLDDLVKRQVEKGQYREYATAKDAVNHLKKLS